MKKFVKPELEIVRFNAEDIMTVSVAGLDVITAGGGDDSYKINKSAAEIEWNNQGI